MPPAAAKWFSLSRTPSPSVSRWFTPPPQRTAYFSRSLVCDQRPTYHPEAAHLAWEMTLRFLKTHLGLLEED